MNLDPVLGACLATCAVAHADLRPAEAPPVAASIQPARAEPRADANSRLAHEQLCAKARQGRIDIYFAGDSITRRWGATDPAYREMLAHWTTNFFGWNAANFGWGGDTVQNVLWRLTNGEFEGVQPKVVVLLAGTNNLRGPTPAGADPAIAAEVVGGLRAIVNEVRTRAPAATVLLMGILPRNEPGGGTAWMPTIREINAQLAGLADGRSVRFLNLDERLAARDGRLIEGLTVDGLHLSVKGYQVWADALKPVFTELLGPPTPTDQAPPPTGDPSVSKAAPATR